MASEGTDVEHSTSNIREPRPTFVVPPFTGYFDAQSPVVFLKNCKQLMKILNLSDRSFLDRWLPSLVTDVAWQWLDEQPSFDTMADFEQAFIRYFLPSDHDEIIRDRLQSSIQRPSEDVQQFGVRLQKLWASLFHPLTEGEKCNLLVRNCQPALRAHILGRKFQNVPACLELLRQVQSTLWEAAQQPSNVVPPLRETTRTASGQPSGSGRERNARQCWICGGIGHISTQCGAGDVAAANVPNVVRREEPQPVPVRRSVQSQEPQPSTSGLSKRGTTGKSTEANALARGMTGNDAIKEHVLPVIDILVDGRFSTKALLDTGANSCVCSTQFLDRIGKPGSTAASKDGNAELITADNRKIKSVGQTKLSLSYKSVEYPDVDFLILPELAYDCILGVDFIARARLVIDLSGISVNNDNSLLTQGVTERKEVLDRISVLCHGKLSEQEALCFLDVLGRSYEVFGEPNGLANVPPLDLQIKTHAPVSSKPHRLTAQKLQEARDVVGQMLEEGLVEPSMGPWCSPVIVTYKKSGKPRLCIDYRELNQHIDPLPYPLPRIESILENIGHPKYITTLDLRAGYWQIPITAKSAMQTAFITPFGVFRPKSLMFGLKTAPALFQRVMDDLFASLCGEGVFVYLDDVIIVSPNLKSHLNALDSVLSILKSRNFRINVDKVQLARSEVTVLGHRVSEEGVSADPEKVASMKQCPPPRNLKELRRFLGAASYYRRFVDNFALIATPLTNLLRKGSTFKWGAKPQEAFDTLIEKLTSTPILVPPDYNRGFKIYCDASDSALGAALMQEGNGCDHVVRYASRTLTPHERLFSTTEKEALAIVYATETFRPYIEGRKVLLLSDHRCLSWLYRQKDPTGRLTRWALRIQGFDIDIKHVSGTLNALADLLSRAVGDITEDTPRQRTVGQNLGIMVLTGSNTEELSKERIRLEQGNDPQIASIRSQIAESPLGIYRDKYILVEDLVCQLGKDGPLVVVPESLTEDVIANHHGGFGIGHGGIRKTLTRVRRSFVWRGMVKQVTRYVLACRLCQEYKSSTQPPQGLAHPIVSPRPWHQVSLDLLGPLPQSRMGNRYLLVVQDNFTRFVLLFPLRAASGAAIGKILCGRVFPVWGCPQVVVADNATHFRNHLFHRIARRFSFTMKYTSYYSPRGNQVERSIKTVVPHLATYLSNDHRGWDQAVGHVMMAMNSAVSDSTGFSPARLLLGREIRTPGHFDLEQPTAGPSTREQWVEWDAAKQAKRVQDEHHAAQQVQRVQTENATRSNRKAKDVRFSQGQKVWRRAHFLSRGDKFFTAKPAPKWEGPFVVHECVSPWTYKLRRLGARQPLTGTFHIKDLKQFVA